MSSRHNCHSHRPKLHEKQFTRAAGGWKSKAREQGDIQGHHIRSPGHILTCQFTSSSVNGFKRQINLTFASYQYTQYLTDQALPRLYLFTSYINFSHVVTNHCMTCGTLTQVNNDLVPKLFGYFGKHSYVETWSINQIEFSLGRQIQIVYWSE